MAIVRWDPFAELNNLHRQVNSLFNDSFGDTQQRGLMPTTDVYSNDKSLTLEAHLPNFQEDEINVEQHEGELTISAKHEEKEHDEKKYLVRESSSQYFRRFNLPANADTSKIDANYTNGILKVTVPYKELPKPKKIAIKSKK